MLLENIAPRLRFRTQHPTMQDTIMKMKRPDINVEKNIHSMMVFVRSENSKNLK